MQRCIMCRRRRQQEELNSVHETFKAHIARYRPELDLARVATGETWLALEALQLGEHSTSAHLNTAHQHT
jgi:ClpP class serine protease